MSLLRNIIAGIVFISLVMVLSGCSKKGEDSILNPPSNDPMLSVPDVYKQNQRLGRGMNMGNALEAPKEGEWGVIIKEEYFQLLKEQGFNSVRIPVKWSAHATTSPPYIIDPNFFLRVDNVITQALNRGLAVVLNIHHYDEIMTDPANHKIRFLALWNSISDHYKNFSGDLFFEVLNEPNNQLTASLWNQYLKEALTIIRQKNPYRTVIACPGNWSGIDNLNTVSLPNDDRNIIVTYHYYNPFTFTHQGADWVSGSDKWLGTKWMGTSAEQSAVTQEFDRAYAWSKANDRPLYMGEFGAFSKADMDSRARWTSFVTRQAEQRAISWSYWEFCSGFGVYDQTKKDWNYPLLSALIPKAI